MGKTPSVHLAYRRKVTGTVTACGRTDAARLTSRPSEVTCGACTRSVAMADAEAHDKHKRSTRNRRRNN